MEMNMRKIILIAALILTASGCATHKDWSATGGSKSDGTVELSYQVGLFEQAQVSEQQALGLAIKRCNAWGYTRAEAFGGVTKQCNNLSSSGCNSWLVTKEYQCID